MSNPWQDFATSLAAGQNIVRDRLMMPYDLAKAAAAAALAEAEAEAAPAAMADAAATRQLTMKKLGQDIETGEYERSIRLPASEVLSDKMRERSVMRDKNAAELAALQAKPRIEARERFSEMVAPNADNKNRQSTFGAARALSGLHPEDWEAFASTMGPPKPQAWAAMGIGWDPRRQLERTPVSMYEPVKPMSPLDQATADWRKALTAKHWSQTPMEIVKLQEARYKFAQLPARTALEMDFLATRISEMTAGMARDDKDLQNRIQTAKWNHEDAIRRLDVDADQLALNRKFFNLQTREFEWGKVKDELDRDATLRGDLIKLRGSIDDVIQATIDRCRTTVASTIGDDYARPIAVNYTNSWLKDPNFIKLMETRKTIDDLLNVRPVGKDGKPNPNAKPLMGTQGSAGLTLRYNPQTKRFE